MGARSKGTLTVPHVTVRQTERCQPERTEATVGEYVALFWLPILGPTSVALARFACSELVAELKGVDVSDSPDARAGWIGAAPAAVRRSADRLVQHRFAHWDDAEHLALAVYPRQFRVPAHRLERLPDVLRAIHAGAERVEGWQRMIEAGRA